MKKHIKSGITLGIVGGLLTFLFGGWSAAVLGIFIGAGLGLSLGGQFERKSPQQLAVEALPASLISAGILVALSLLQNFVVQPATGKAPAQVNSVIMVNVIAFLVVALLSIITTALHGLSADGERKAKLILLAVIVVLLPFIDSATGLRWTSQLIFALIFVILGLGLNIVVGYAGLLDLGYAAFFAIGAYTTGILSSPQHDIFMNFWLVIWIAAGMAAVSGLILGAPTLPLRGDYLAIVTLGFGEIIPVVFKNLIKVTLNEPLTCWVLPKIFKIQTACYTFPWFGGKRFVDIDLTAGEKGINPIGRPVLPIIALNEPMSTALFIKIAILLIGLALLVFLFVRTWKGENRGPVTIIGFGGALVALIIFFVPIPHPNNKLFNSLFGVIQPGEFQSDKPVTWYFLIIGIILLSIFIINRLRESRLGRAWMAIREDELAAAQMGINPVRTKLMAFAMGATFSGFAGAFYAAYIRGIFPSVFDFSASIMILCVVILGGLGNVNGVIVGGLVIMTADRLFLPALKDLLKGLMDSTILPALAGNHTLQSAVAQNANPILYRFLLFGLTLVIMMAVRPEGLIPSAQIRQELHSAEEEAGKPAAQK